LITPAITITDGDQVSFYAASVGTWLETFNVKVSTTDTDMASFTIDLGTEADISADWTKYTYVPTDDAGISDGDVIYVAVQVVSVDANVMTLDNFDVAQPAITSDIAVEGQLAGKYTIIPEFFTTEFDLSAEVSNTGAELPAGQVVNVSEEGGTYTGTATTTAAIPDASSEVVSVTPIFSPAAVGDYTIAFETLLSEDTDMTNNYDTVSVSVSDSIYARDLGPDGGSMGIGDAADGILGQLYEIESEVTLTSVTFMLNHPTSESTTVKLYAYVDSVSGTELATSETISVDTTTAAMYSIYTVPINATLAAGTYFIGLEEPNAGNITLATSPMPAANAEAWVYYNSAWQPATDFGFYHTYVLRANLDNTVDIAENADAGVSVYPNPANNVVTVENAENAQITIVNMVGQVVASQVANSNRESINISDLSNGTYVIRIENGNEVSTQKLNVIR
jgi:hypothetical protein